MFLAASMVYGQGVGASGDIKGVVTDASGAVVTNATVTATDAEKGLQRTGTTDKSGEYRISGLAPAGYDVSVAASGFSTSIQKGVVINVGETVTLDFHLKVSAAAEKIEVTTEPPIVETARGHQADTVNEQYIRNLPIDRRDYLTYTLLMPGVNDSRTLANSHDFRVAQTPQSGLSFYGSNGRGNNVTVDGGEYSNDSGGVRPTISQDAVQEFQINRSNYAAEFGSASGATINIVSKTGTNNIHGSAFGYFRDDAFDAQDPYSFKPALAPGQTFNPASPDSIATPVKNGLSRQQFGATVGFPLVKDKTFLFFSGEGLRDRQHVALPLLTTTNIFRPQADSFNNQQAIIDGLRALGNTQNVPCIVNQTAIPAAICAGILTTKLSLSNDPTSLSYTPTANYIINQLEQNGGTFPFSENEALASGRLDHQISSTDTLHLRYTFGRDNSANSNLQALTGLSRGFSTKQLDHTLQVGWFHEFTPSILNELRVQWNFSKLDVIPNSQGQVGIEIPGYASLGSDIFQPNFTMMHRYEFTDNITFTRGHHTMKAGFYELVRRNRTTSETFFPGRFVFGSLPAGLFLSPCLQVPAACSVNAAPAALNAIQSFALQSSLIPTFGLPQFYQQGFGNPSLAATLPLTAFYWQDSWVVRPNFTLNFGARYELDERQAIVTDNDNVAPRISFAWDPFKSGKTVVRGGYGIFYSPVYYQIDDVVRTLGNINNTRQIANYFVPLTGLPTNPALTSAAVFATLFGQGKVQCHNPAAGQFACITPADLAQFGINVTNTGTPPPFSVLFDSSPNYQNPYSQQASFGIERELGWGFSVAANYIYAHTIRLPRAIDTNLLAAPFTTKVTPLGQALTYQNWAAPQCSAVATSCFAIPLILQNNTYTSSASAIYHGGIFELKKRMSNYFSLLLNYTYSKAIDDSTDYNSDYEPFNQLLPHAERSLSEFDQRHKIVITSLIESPIKGEGLASAIFGGFTLSPIFRGNTSHPFNLLAGTDVNGDRHSTTDRPLGAARNSGIGPDFYTFDMGLSRRFHFGHEGWSVQLLAQAFNLFNRTNFATVQNVVGPNYGPGFVTGQSFSTGGVRNVFPNVPLSFDTNPLTAPKREFQFGIRLDF
jgi:hypothetical protein